MEQELDAEWILIQVWKYNPNMKLELDLDPELPPHKKWPHFGCHMLIKSLDGSSCKKICN